MTVVLLKAIRQEENAGSPTTAGLQIGNLG